MTAVELVLLLLAVAALLQVVATRLTVPLPILLVVGGLVLAVAPGVPRLTVDPQVVFVVFVPPLLYWGAVTASWREFKLRAWPIFSLSVGLVLVTMAAVAIVVRAISPAFTWPAAFALGAIVSPPDPVSAIAVLRSLGVPKTIESILEGEGLANDATSLVAYRIAVAAGIGGSFSLGGAATRLVVGGAGAIIYGLLLGQAIRWIFSRTERLPIVQNTILLLTPFAAFIPADNVGASGVLAVVAAGLSVGRTARPKLSAVMRIQSESMWTVLAFILESLVFIIIGLELPVVAAALPDYKAGTLIAEAAIVSLVCIVVRLLWVFPSAWLTGNIKSGWRRVLFVGWAGLRGGDSLVLALALPLAMPARNASIVITFGVIVATLVIQGLTLAPVTRLLGLRNVADVDGDAEEARAWLAARTAAVNRLQDVPGEPAARLRARLVREARRWRARADKGVEATKSSADEREATAERDLRCALVDEERKVVRDLLERGEIDDAVARHLDRYLDLETIMLDYPMWDADESPFESSPA